MSRPNLWRRLSRSLGSNSKAKLNTSALEIPFRSLKLFISPGWRRFSRLVENVDIEMSPVISRCPFHKWRVLIRYSFNQMISNRPTPFEVCISTS